MQEVLHRVAISSIARQAHMNWRDKPTQGWNLGTAGPMLTNSAVSLAVQDISGCDTGQLPYNSAQRCCRSPAAGVWATTHGAAVPNGNFFTQGCFVVRRGGPSRFLAISWYQHKAVTAIHGNRVPKFLTGLPLRCRKKPGNETNVRQTTRKQHDSTD